MRSGYSWNGRGQLEISANREDCVNRKGNCSARVKESVRAITSRCLETSSSADVFVSVRSVSASGEGQQRDACPDASNKLQGWPGNYSRFSADRRRREYRCLEETTGWLAIAFGYPCKCASRHVRWVRLSYARPGAVVYFGTEDLRNDCTRRSLGF